MGGIKQISESGKLIQRYMIKYNGLSKSQIARKIYDEFPHLFKHPEQIRRQIRYYTKSQGESNRKRITKNVDMSNQIKTDDAILQRWGIKKGKAQRRKVYQIPAERDRILWISDIHFPNHDEQALTVALEYGLDNNANCIVIGGDLLDNAPFTRFTTPPDKKKAREYFDMAIDFLAALRANFPEALIVYMEGNHDRWYTDWLINNCAVIFDDPYYQLEARLGLDEFEIEFLKENVMVKAGKLPMLHGHTIIRGIFAPVNAARGAYLRSKHNLLIGHTHQVSMHSEKDISGKATKTWSTGCLCVVPPAYDPHNTKQTHGFAWITTQKGGDFTVNNFEIIDGRIR